jgi:hypothetical protein
VLPNCFESFVMVDSEKEGLATELQAAQAALLEFRLRSIDQQTLANRH